MLTALEVQALGLSLWVSSGSVAVSLAPGVALGWLLARRDFRGKRLVIGLLSLPLVIPHPVAGIALLLLFARGSLLGSILEGRLGIEVVSAAPGVVLAMLFVSAPLVVRAIEEGFHAIDPRLEQVSRSLGASDGTTFLRISLPLVRPAIVAGATSGAHCWARTMNAASGIIRHLPVHRSPPIPARGRGGPTASGHMEARYCRPRRTP